MAPMEKFEVVPSAAAVASQDSDVPDTLPQVPFRLVVVGSSNSGKSVLVASLLSAKFPYAKIFGRNVWIFSPTMSLQDPSFSELKIPDDHVIPFYDEATITRIVTQQGKIIKQHGKSLAKNLLLVFDDCMTQISNSPSSLLRSLYFSGRHQKISVICLTQLWTAMPRAARMNASDVVLFEQGRKQRMNIGEEQSIDPQKFSDIMEAATGERPFSFLYVRLKKPTKERYMLRFTGRLYSTTDP